MLRNLGQAEWLPTVSQGELRHGFVKANTSRALRSLVNRPAGVGAFLTVGAPVQSSTNKAGFFCTQLLLHCRLPWKNISVPFI